MLLRNWSEIRMRKVRILLYHRVEYLNDDFNMQAVTPNNFEKHMKFLHDHYDVIGLNTPMEEWFNGGEKNAVIITFDDGYYDFLYNAIPILKKYHMPATIFVATGNIDTECENWTDSILRIIFSNSKQKDFFIFDNQFYHGKCPTRNYKEKYDFYQMVRRIFLVSNADERRRCERELLEWAGLEKEGRKDRRIMTSEEIRRLAEIEGISIGAHTVTHAALKMLNVSEQRSEILESKQILEQIVGKEVTLFSYPFGTRDEYSEVTVQLVKEAGFEKAVVAYSADINEETDIYELNRFVVKNYDEKDFAEYIENVVFGSDKGVRIEDNGDSCTPINYIGKLEEDHSVLNSDFPVVVWGTGYWGKRLYSELSMLKIGHRIVAFGDNNPDKCGDIISNIPVKTLDEIKEVQERKQCHILIRGKYDFEICMKLIKSGLKYIHIIQM